MRTPTEHVAKDGTRTYKIKYRQGGTTTSETFRRLSDAKTFAAILDGGGILDAHAWLKARDTRAHTITFGDWHDQYVDRLTGVTPRTKDDYHALRRRYLGNLEQLPLPLITRAHVSGLVNRLDREGKSPKTIKNVVHMLSSCLALAVEDEHMARNPCLRIRLPAAKHTDEDDLFLTPDEFHTLAHQIPDHYQPLVTFLVGTGMRWSEVTALESRYVDLAAGTIRVRQAWKRIPGGFEIGPPKSPKSRRTVNAAVMALAAAEPLLGKPNDYVFRTPTGGVISHSNFYNRIWKPAVTRSGLQPRPKIKDLRHTHASWLISDGCTLEQVQDQLGHESILTTRGVYGHLLPALGVAVGKSASEALARALPDGLQGLRRQIASGPDQVT